MASNQSKDQIDEILDMIRAERRERRISRFQNIFLEDGTLTTASISTSSTPTAQASAVNPATSPSAVVTPAIRAANPPSNASLTVTPAGSNALQSLNPLTIGGIAFAAVTMLAITGFLIFQSKKRTAAKSIGSDEESSEGGTFRRYKSEKMMSGSPMMSMHARPMSTLSLDSIPPTISTRAFFLSQQPLAAPTTLPPDMPLPPPPAVGSTAIPFSRGTVRQSQPHYGSDGTMSSISSDGDRYTNYYHLSEGSQVTSPELPVTNATENVLAVSVEASSDRTIQLPVAPTCGARLSIRTIFCFFDRHQPISQDFCIRNYTTKIDQHFGS